MESFSKHTVTATDGTVIAYETIGRGPGIIIVHGALSDIEEYTQLANALSTAYTVHLMQRRGRQAVDIQDEVYNIEKECDDLLTVQEMTRAEFLFGHSFGGLIALETVTKSHPFKKVIVYEPGVSINGNWDWITAYEKAMKHQKYRQAFTAFVQGMGHTPLSKVPRWLASFILRIAIRGKEWELKKNLLVSNLREHREVKRLEDSYRKYSGISVPVLFAGGQASPDFIHRMLGILTDVIPEAQVILMPGQQHLAPQNGEAPILVSNEIRCFLNEPSLINPNVLK